jgi:hypothetical protein
MPFFYRAFSIAFVLCVSAELCSAQSLPCPKPKRQKVYTEPPQLFFDIAAGVAMPFMYRNTGDLESHFHFSSRPGPYVAATGHMKRKRNGLELTVGAEILHNQQGLVLKYNEGDANVRETGFTGSLVFRLPVGIGYYIKPNWTVNANAFIAYTSFWTYTNSGRQSINGGNGGAVSSQHQWNVPNAYNRWYPGIGLSTQVGILRKLSAKAFCSMDFGQATPNAGTISIASGGRTETLHASLEPYLMNVGLALSFRLGKMEE